MLDSFGENIFKKIIFFFFFFRKSFLDAIFVQILVRMVRKWSTRLINTSKFDISVETEVLSNSKKCIFREMTTDFENYGMQNVTLLDIFFISIGSYFITIVYFWICI